MPQVRSQGLVAHSADHVEDISPEIVARARASGGAGLTTRDVSVVRVTTRMWLSRAPPPPPPTVDDAPANGAVEGARKLAGEQRVVVVASVRDGSPAAAGALAVLQAVHKECVASGAALIATVSARIRARPRGGSREPPPTCLTHAAFLERLEERGMATCFGADLTPTTFAAKTVFQPRPHESASPDDVSWGRADAIVADPEDHVVFYRADVASVSRVERDNTGRFAFVENAPFPSTTFPATHALLSCVMVLRSDADAVAGADDRDADAGGGAPAPE